MNLSDNQKAMSLFRKYLRSTELEDRVSVHTSMPLKLIVKRFDNTYRNKVVGDDIELKLIDAYFSKKDDLIAVFDIHMAEEDLPSELQDSKHVEIPTKLLSDRLAEGEFNAMMAQIAEVTDGEFTKEDAYSMPVEKESYDVIEEFGSWS